MGFDAIFDIIRYGLISLVRLLREKTMAHLD